MVSIFHQLGERDAEHSAQQFMEMTRRAIEREKNKSTKWKKKRPSKKASTVSRASGLTLPNPATNDQEEGRHRTISRPQRVRPPLAVDGIATLTAAQRTEFEKIKRESNMRSVESLASACIFENPAYTHLQEEYHNGDIPGLAVRPAVHNEYYQQWMRMQQGQVRTEEAIRQEAADGIRRSTSPVFSDSGWSHNRTLGLSPESPVDWSYPNPYMYTFGGGFNHAARAQAAQSPRRTASPPYSQPISRNRGYATVMQVHHNDDDDDDDDETNSDYTSIREEEEETEEDEEEGEEVGRREEGHNMATNSTHCQTTQHQLELERDRVSSLRQRQVMRSTSSCSMIGSERHLQELEKLSHDFTQPKADEQLELSEGVDKEWEQWIKMQEDE